MKSGKVSSSDGEVCNELSVLVSIVGVVRAVVLSVIKGESCHDMCTVSSDQLVISLPEWLRQGVLSVLDIHTVDRVLLGAIVPYHDMPLLLESLVRLGQPVVVVVVVSWGICGLVSVSRMHTVRRWCAAAVIDCVIRRCGAVTGSARGLGGGVLSFCWCGGAVAAVSCRSGWLCDGCRSAVYLKLLSASSRSSAVSVKYESTSWRRDGSLSRCLSEWLLGESVS